MPQRITEVDRIIQRIGVAVDVDAGEGAVECVGGEEAAEQRVVIAGVQILQSGLGVVGLADIGLAVADGRIGGGHRPAIGVIVMAVGRCARARERLQPVAPQVILRQVGDGVAGLHHAGCSKPSLDVRNGGVFRQNDVFEQSAWLRCPLTSPQKSGGLYASGFDGTPQGGARGLHSGDGWRSATAHGLSLIHI